ncbi:hypothetical protein [Streptomyces boluensis]|uniref:WG repeat-containing protein n=1 Tax=Streptomyces boluensis TaxID=1775135 RepID=A0A964US90_9ACTN|nr:hypothetical protein [Streptomyces boluensis]NBE53506.1 hypothetical protein [Streptomyces boluensis]
MRPPPVGAYVIDTGTDRLGRVMGYGSAGLLLRPYGAGRPWSCAAEGVRLATPAERLRAATSYANARSRGEVW